ncbi:PhnO protein [Fibrisoma limi BUZ 3]|uniref:PhnO protein n=1 Tax=Fibrisoma limi BUZ 3 TaxID=1185876 RepID=I2GP13_9BACT|nr:GNAT family N-acetyltransferase [Fibrisoma limi]CCH55641.1 PhnO protein [Fibrisoma limi BUZ 3]
MQILAESPMAVVIRSATQQDGDAIYNFLCDLEDTTLNPTAFRAIFRHNLTNPLIHYLVADLNNKVIGFVSCHVQYLLHHTGKVGEIQELYVRPEFRGQRIGKQLMAAVDDLAQQHGFINLEVTTNQHRTATVQFYEQLAFHPTHCKLVKSLSS